MAHAQTQRERERERERETKRSPLEVMSLMQALLFQASITTTA